MFVPPVNTHQRVTSTEGDFNNQVDRMVTHFVDTSQSLCSATLVINKWANEQNGYGGRDRIYAWAQQQGLPITKVILAMAITECPICPQQRQTLSP